MFVRLLFFDIEFLFVVELGGGYELVEKSFELGLFLLGFGMNLFLFTLELKDTVVDHGFVVLEGKLTLVGVFVGLLTVTNNADTLIELVLGFQDLLAKFDILEAALVVSIEHLTKLCLNFLILD